MKELTIRMPPRLTECKVIIYTLPYYSGITVRNGIIIATDVLGNKLRKNLNLRPGLVPGISVSETFKLIHESARFGIVLDSSVTCELHYGIVPELSGIVLDTDVEKLHALACLRPENGILLACDPVIPQISRSLGHGESGIVIDSAVDGMLKLGFFGDDTQTGFVIGGEAGVVKSTLALPEEHGIVIEPVPALATLCKTTGAENALIFDSEGDAILSHSLGRMETGILVVSDLELISKSGFPAIDAGFLLDVDDLETKRLNNLERLENEMLLLSELKNLCYLIQISGESGLIVDTEGTGTLKKVLYGTESGFVITGEAQGSTTKLIEAESGIVVDAEGTGMLVKLGNPDEAGVVLKPEGGADLKRYRLLEEIYDMTLEDIGDMTLEELYYVWLT